MGREEELAELAAFCQEAGGYRWWRAPAWAGKSALMSWFVLHPPLDRTYLILIVVDEV
jgi:hypothetical protein